MLLKNIVRKENNMKPYTYEVSFVAGGTEIVHCFGQTDARILAQANRINKGMDYEIKAVVKL